MKEAAGINQSCILMQCRCTSSGSAAGENLPGSIAERLSILEAGLLTQKAMPKIQPCACMYIEEGGHKWSQKSAPDCFHLTRRSFGVKVGVTHTTQAGWENKDFCSTAEENRPPHSGVGGYG